MAPVRRPPPLYHESMRFVLCALAVATAALAQDFAGSALLDQAIDDAIRRQEIPGAVLIVGHDGKILHRKAYGNRVLIPKAEPMTVDTIFDCASLTKVIATTSSLKKLFEQGKFRLNDRITQYIPEIGGKDGRRQIRIGDRARRRAGSVCHPVPAGEAHRCHLAAVRRRNLRRDHVRQVPGPIVRPVVSQE
jgi:CubicO group peptidase (beta-lactamase class C family)